MTGLEILGVALYLVVSLLWALFEYLEQMEENYRDGRLPATLVAVFVFIMWPVVLLIGTVRRVRNWAAS